MRQINYRRFFDINGLIGVCVENPAVFESLHCLIFDLATSGKVSGFRVDHVDGLYNPEQYLKELRQKLPDHYFVVEKILTGTEQLPTSWPVQGTTGYDFLNCINKVFIQAAAETEIDGFYRQFTGNKQAFSDQLYDCKKHVVETLFLGDVKNLARLLNRTLQDIGYSGKLSPSGLRAAVVELMACFPVYRTYNSMQNRDYEPFKVALNLAAQKNPHLAEEFTAIKCLLEKSQTTPQALHAIMRLQQFTGAVMAKGFEDTAFYRYSRFLSVNEVGGNPAEFSLSTGEFHEFNLQRQQKWPLTLNATSTHDTKRGEDARARLNVISEIPSEFAASVDEWAMLNRALKRRINGELLPSSNEEFYLYQTLLGSYPLDEGERQRFSERVKLHMVKALREAKVNSSWLKPNLEYEQAAVNFSEELLNSESFLAAFLPFQKKTAFYGFFNSLSQTLLKATCPGVPDFYQGTELWDLNLVDPDNRRPVGFQKRQKTLMAVSALEPSKAPSLLDHYADGEAKLYLIYKTLQFRRKFKELFTEGSYIPLTIKGRRSENIIAFCRKKDNLFVVIIAPRFLAGLIKPQTSWNKAQIDWADTSITLPDTAPSRFTEVFTGRTVGSKFGLLPLRDALDDFPVALLLGGDSSG